MPPKKIVVLTDSSANTPANLQSLKNNVVIPLWLRWEGESLWDGVIIHSHAFYIRLKSSKNLPTSSLLSSQEISPYSNR